MTQNDKNVLNTLNVLNVLFRANKQKIPNLSDEEQYTLTVTKEHLQNDNISISVFINTLQTLAEKGYLFATCIFESEYHDKIREVFSDEVFTPAVQKLSEDGKNSLTEEQKLVFAYAMQELLPPNLKTQFDVEGFAQEEIKLTDLLNDTRNAFKNHRDDTVAKIILFPFRDIDKVLKQMNGGKTFDEIIDSDICYNDQKFEFHIGKELVVTSYQDKPNIEHYILQLIPEHLDDGVIWYDEVEDRTSRSIKDALLKFVAKNKKLEDIFTVHSNRLEFDVEAFK
jgi:hypothetical protein